MLHKSSGVFYFAVNPKVVSYGSQGAIMKIPYNLDIASFNCEYWGAAPGMPSKGDVSLTDPKYTSFATNSFFTSTNVAIVDSAKISVYMMQS